MKNTMKNTMKNIMGLTALALVAVPYLAHAAWPQVPSLPTVLAWLIEHLLAVGAMTA